MGGVPPAGHRQATPQGQACVITREGVKNSDNHTTVQQSGSFFKKIFYCGETT